jgi:hypothetical protein
MEREVKMIFDGSRTSAVLMYLFSCGSMGTMRRRCSNLPAGGDDGEGGGCVRDAGESRVLIGAMEVALVSWSGIT